MLNWIFIVLKIMNHILKVLERIYLIVLIFDLIMNKYTITSGILT